MHYHHIHYTAIHIQYHHHNDWKRQIHYTLSICITTTTTGGEMGETEEANTLYGYPYALPPPPQRPLIGPAEGQKECGDDLLPIMADVEPMA
jgi:hypothetical protein